MVLREKFSFQCMGIGQISVVHQHQTKRRIDIKRLRFFFTECIARSGVTHLAQAIVARQCTHIACTKHIAHHAFFFVHEEFTVQLGDDARSILATVL